MMLVLLYCCSAFALFLTLRFLLRKLRVGNYNSKFVFITGCDTGFGNLLAKRLDKLGFHVFAGCLTEKGSKDLAAECSGRLSVLLLDVTDENSVQNARQHVESKLPKNKGLWAIVNNAGVIGAAGPLEWQSTKTLRRTININLLGVMFVAKEFLPLVRHERGRVINMASIFGRFALGGTDYTASKFGVEGFSDQLRRELFHTGVSVHIIEPGFFQTELYTASGVMQMMRNNFQQAPSDVKRYYGESYLETVVKGSSKFLSRVVSHDVYKVVDAYEHAITAKFPKARYVVGWDAQIFYRFLWNLPEWLCDWIMCKKAPIPDGAKQ